MLVRFVRGLSEIVYQLSSFEINNNSSSIVGLFAYIYCIKSISIFFISYSFLRGHPVNPIRIKKGLFLFLFLFCFCFVLFVFVLFLFCFVLFCCSVLTGIPHRSSSRCRCRFRCRRPTCPYMPPPAFPPLPSPLPGRPRAAPLPPPRHWVRREGCRFWGWMC